MTITTENNVFRRGYGYRRNLLASQRFGRERVRAVMQVLERAVESGAIMDLRETIQNGPEDQAGKDIVFYRSGTQYALQIKSRRDHARHFRRNHPDIPVIIPDLDHPNSIIGELRTLFPFLP